MAKTKNLEAPLKFDFVDNQGQNSQHQGNSTKTQKDLTNIESYRQVKDQDAEIQPWSQ